MAHLGARLAVANYTDANIDRLNIDNGNAITPKKNVKKPANETS